MATTWKAPTWRMPNDKNQSKFESYSIDFNGMDPLNCGNSDTLNIASSNYSISTWVKYTTTANQVVCEKGSNNQLALQIGGSGNQGKISWIGGADYVVTSANTINDGNWHHVCCVAYGSSSILYIDGQISATGGSKTVNANTSNFMIGGRGTSYGFSGSISQLCLFDYDLSSAQVSSLYNSGSPINPMTLKPTPIAYYPLGGNASTGGDSSSTLSVPNVAVPDASVFNFDNNPTILFDNNFFTPSGTVGGTGNFMQVSSISWWMKSSRSGSYSVIFPFDANNAWMLRIDNLGNMWWFAGAGTNYVKFNNVTANSINLCDSQWHHCVFTIPDANDKNQCKFFIDNQEITSTTTAGASTGYGALYIMTKLQLAGGYLGDIEGTEISNVQVWLNTALGNSDINTIYNNGVPLLTGTQPQEANLKAWYKLDQSANWEADTAGEWQIPDAVSSYPQSFDFLAAPTYSRISLGTTSFTGNKTISFWLNKGSNNGTVLGFGNTNHYPNVQSTTLQLNNGSTTTLSTGTINLNEWNHYVITGDGTTAKCYVNGIYKSTGTDRDISSSATWIGGQNNGTGMLLGKLSNVQQWETVLTDGGVLIGQTAGGEIAKLYNNGVPLTTAIASDNLKAWYKLNDSLDLFSGNLPDVMFLPNDYKQNFTKALKIADTAGKSINLASSLNLGTEHTISYWLISPASWGTRGGSIATDGSQNRIYISNGSAYYRASGGTQVYDSNMGWGWYGQAGVWYNFVITRKDGNVNFYNNGSITSSSPHSFTASETLSLKDFLGHSSQWGETIISNVVILDKELTSSEVTTMYNNGNPIYNLSDIPQSSNVKLWWKLNTDPSSNIVDSSGNNQTGVTSNYVSSDLKNIAVGTNSGKTSGMTEQNLVNNNVSALNGESSGMDTSNLVTSTLTRKVPYNSYSLNFDGINDYIQLASSSTAIVDWTQPYSISLWVNYSNPLSWDLIATFGIETGSASTTRYIMIGGNSGYLFTGVGDEDGGTTDIHFNIGSGLDQGNWHHLVYVGDGSSGDYPSVYIDGVLTPYSGGTTGLYNSSTYLNVIGTGSNASGRYFPGKISNVSIFNKALTSTEVMKLYNSGVPSDLSSFHPSPSSWWSLGSDSYYNGSAWICPDLIGTNNGTGPNMDAVDLEGNAPNSTANGTSSNMTIGTNLTGSAPNSSNNSFSVNMSFDDRVSGAGNVPE